MLLLTLTEDTAAAAIASSFAEGEKKVKTKQAKWVRETDKAKEED